jgi:hypothetical protein
MMLLAMRSAIALATLMLIFGGSTSLAQEKKAEKAKAEKSPAISACWTPKRTT